MVSQLYEGDTGVLVGPIDEGDGLREKTWLDELSHIAQEMANERGLASAGSGRLANFPAIINGQRMGTKPIGEAYSTPNYSGVELSFLIPQTQVLGTGDAAALTFGATALTEDDISHINYRSTPTDPDTAPAPVGGQHAAFIQTIVDGGGLNLSGAGDNILTLIVNGTTYSITITAAGGLAATVAEDVRDSIARAGVPVILNVNTLVTERLRIWAPGMGSSTSLLVPATGAGAILFTGAGASAAAGTTYTGNGGPLNQMDNNDVVGASRPQRRILPGSISVAATLGAEVIAITDSAIASGTTGTLAGQNAAGTATVTGTINYVTGEIALTFAGDAPDAATNVTARFWALVPVTLSDPVRQPVAGRNMALRLL